jgi:hypothetical protein
MHPAFPLDPTATWHVSLISGEAFPAVVLDEARIAGRLLVVMRDPKTREIVFGCQADRVASFTRVPAVAA